MSNRTAKKTRLEWSQWMVSKHEGTEVFIAVAGSKSPLKGKSWKEFQSADPEKLAQWFGQYPNCNFGVQPGEGYAVVDLDIKPDCNGIETFDKICAENGIMDFLFDIPTLMVRTPSGGYHLYFRVPFGVANANKFPDGIDVRGVGGYVIGPGCEIDGSGNYEVIDENAPIMDAPDWLVKNYLVEPGYKDPNQRIPLVKPDQPQHIAQAEEWIKTQEPAVEGMSGDHHTFVICCGIRDFGISEDECFRILTESGWNDRCDPPWDSEGLERKIENSYRYAENRAGTKSDEYKVRQLTSAHPAGGYANLTDQQIDEIFHPKSLLDKYKLGEYVRPENDDDSEIPTDVGDNETLVIEKVKDEDKWFGFEDFIKRDKIREYIVSDWLLAHGITGVIAARGTGKSVISLDLACRLATDRDWWGISTLRGWCVIYMCGEDEEGMIVNGRAWAQHYGEAPSNDRFLVCNEILSLSTDQKVIDKLEYMKNWARGRRVITILDTWQRATAGVGKSENETEDVINRAEMVSKELNGPLLVCYHPPKDGRMTIRNSAVQEDTTTVLWNLEEETDGIKLSVNRIKGAGKGNWRKFNFEKIAVGGMDQHGKPIEGIIPIKFAGTEEEDSPDSVKRAKDIRRAWATAIKGCNDFPMEDNPIEKLKSFTNHNINTMLRHMWENGNIPAIDPAVETYEQNFVRRYMGGMKEYKQTNKFGKDSVTKALDMLFFDKHLTAGSVENVTFDDGSVLVIEGGPGERKTIRFD